MTRNALYKIDTELAKKPYGFKQIFFLCNEVPS